MKPQSISAGAARKTRGELLAEAEKLAGGKIPSLPMRKIQARPVPSQESDEAKAAREAFSIATGGQPVAPAAAAAIGNTTFDGLPDELATRRAKVAGARQRLADLAARVNKAHADLTPILDDLADDADALKAGEAFDCEVARGFLNGLKTVVDGVSAPEAPLANGTEAIPEETAP